MLYELTGWAHTLMQNLHPEAPCPKYQAADSRKLSAQYIFIAELDKV